METEAQREDSPPGLDRIKSPALVRTAPATRTPLEMLDRALTSGMTPDVIQKLMDLAERHERNEAKRAFDNAIAAAKAEMPTIVKNRKVDFSSGKGRTSYAYEDLAGVLSTVEPVLAKHGLGIRYISKVEGSIVVVTCILFHSAGHQVETSLPGPYDNSGNKNPIQQMGSTVTYLQRYTLKVALGLAAAQDDDGQASGARPDEPDPLMDDGLVQRLYAHIEKTEASLDKVMKWLKVKTFYEVPASQFDNIIRELDLAKAKRDAKAKPEPIVAEETIKAVEAAKAP